MQRIDLRPSRPPIRYGTSRPLSKGVDLHCNLLQVGRSVAMSMAYSLRQIVDHSCEQQWTQVTASGESGGRCYKGALSPCDRCIPGSPVGSSSGVLETELDPSAPSRMLP